MDLQALELSQTATLERFNRRQDRVASDQGYGATAGALAITRSFFPEVATVISERLSEAPAGLTYVIRNLDPHVMAVSALTSLLHMVATGRVLREAALRVGFALQGECWAAGLLAENAKLHARIERAVKLRHANIGYRKQAARSIAAKAGYRASDWSRTDALKAGTWLLDCCLRALPDVFCLEGPERGEKYPQVTPGALALAERAVDETMRANPAFVPCVEAPRPWTGFRRGGFWDDRTPLSAVFVRAYHKASVASIKAAMSNGMLGPHMDAVNALQAVPWKINTRVLDVVQWCFDHNVEVKGLPAKELMGLPERLSEEDWNDEAKRKQHRYNIAQTRERNRNRVSNRILFAQDMATASRLATEQSFYTPANCDWRGRVYPVPHFNFQRDDRVRALFLFANGMPIGEQGLYWLKVHLANCGDFDKISKQPFAERVAWVEQNLPMIQAVAACPQQQQQWTQADKPFLFLATCLELIAAMNAGSSFVTSLPISFDGSCSGLQHLCAMTRATEGALVNLTPNECPQDVYQTVADLVKSRIEEDAKLELGIGPLARQALAHGITRKLVKRNVMTYGYSSKPFGMSQQHMEDLMRPLSLEVLEGARAEHPFGEDEGLAASKYLAGHVYAAIETVVHLPAQAMTFLQKCARALAHEGKALSWTTPTGLPWCNRYHETNAKQVKLWLSDVRVTVMLADGASTTIDKDRAANGVAPNFVHALDASHLALTVNAAVREGISDIATVHDSFGCLAAQADRFRRIIREQFVDMYEQHDVLAEVLDAAKRDLTVHNWERLPALPQAGPLDLQEVLNAEFAFA